MLTRGSQYVRSAWIAPVLVTGVCCVLGNGVYYLVTIGVLALGLGTVTLALLIYDD